MKKETEIHDFKQYCDEMLKKYNVPGFAIGLAKESEWNYKKEFGFRDTEAKLPLSPDTIFGVGSLTKAFTAVAILQLQEKGKLNLNDPVINYLPEFKTPNEVQTKQITIHHFLTHTSYSAVSHFNGCGEEKYGKGFKLRRKSAARGPIGCNSGD